MQKTIKRIDSLDWQRGLLALAIMLYHLTSWQFSSLDASSLLGRLGIYGVSMFFVLSGLSMAIVYHGFIDGIRTSVSFFIRRIFRIWPLLWLVIAFTVIVGIAEGSAPSWRLVLFNLTTAFGFLKPSLYLNVGAWSIGNEMVYYALTPLILHAFNKNLNAGNLLVAGSVLAGLVFSSGLLDANATLAAQWNVYINPFNNLFLYYLGIALYYNAHSWVPGKISNFLCFAIPVLIFVFYPVEGNQINIVTGLNRVVFCAASIVLVLAFYKNRFAIPQAFSRPLTHLGVLTYGVYLLHPVAYQATLMVVKHFEMAPNPYAIAIVTIATTLILAQTAFTLLEDPCIRIGKRLTARPIAAPRTEEASTHSGSAL